MNTISNDSEWIVSRKIVIKSLSRHFAPWKSRQFFLDRSNALLGVRSTNNTISTIPLYSPTLVIQCFDYNTDDKFWLTIRYRDVGATTSKEIIMKFDYLAHLIKWKKALTEVVDTVRFVTTTRNALFLKIFESYVKEQSQIQNIAFGEEQQCEAQYYGGEQSENSSNIPSMEGSIASISQFAPKQKAKCGSYDGSMCSTNEHTVPQSSVRSQSRRMDSTQIINTSKNDTLGGQYYHSSYDCDDDFCVQASKRLPTPQLSTTGTTIYNNKLEVSVQLKVPPMRILMMAVGTRGDVQPFLQLGLRLQLDGHRVRIATHACFREYISARGLEFYPLAGDPLKLSEFMVKTQGFVIPTTPELLREAPAYHSMVVEMIYSAWGACVQPDPHDSQCRPFVADAIISNPVSYAHIHCAEALGVPLHLMFPQPWIPTKAFPHPLACMSYQQRWSAENYLSYQVVDQMMWLSFERDINAFRKNILGLQPLRVGQGGWNLQNILKVPFVKMWSPSLVPKPKDWPDYVDVVGNFFEAATTSTVPATTSINENITTAQQQPPPYQPSAELLSFLSQSAEENGGKQTQDKISSNNNSNRLSKPIFVGFGSMVIADIEGLISLFLQAAALANVRIIVQLGWSEITPERFLSLALDAQLKASLVKETERMNNSSLTDSLIFPATSAAAGQNDDNDDDDAAADDKTCHGAARKVQLSPVMSNSSLLLRLSSMHAVESSGTLDHFTSDTGDDDNNSNNNFSNNISLCNSGLSDKPAPHEVSTINIRESIDDDDDGDHDEFDPSPISSVVGSPSFHNQHYYKNNNSRMIPDNQDVNTSAASSIGNWLMRALNLSSTTTPNNNNSGNSSSLISSSQLPAGFNTSKTGNSNDKARQHHQQQQNHKKHSQQKEDISSAWDEIENDGWTAAKSAYFLGSCPHDWLFQHVAAVVHHGGAGTTAAGLRYGCPTWVCPFFGDQYFWGEMIQRRGLGPKPCAISHLTLPIVAESLEALLQPVTAQTAAAVSIAMQKEDGVEAACRAFYKHLPLESMLCDVSLFRGEYKLAQVYCSDCKLKMSQEVSQELHNDVSLHLQGHHTVFDVCRYRDWTCPAPTNATDGLLQGIGGLVHELKDGVTDALCHPVKGGYQHGLTGAAAGLSSGLNSLISKPLSGGNVLVKKITEGIRASMIARMNSNDDSEGPASGNNNDIFDETAYNIVNEQQQRLHSQQQINSQFSSTTTTIISSEQLSQKQNDHRNNKLSLHTTAISSVVPIEENGLLTFMQSEKTTTILPNDSRSSVVTDIIASTLPMVAPPPSGNGNIHLVSDYDEDINTGILDMRSITNQQHLYSNEEDVYYYNSNTMVVDNTDEDDGENKDSESVDNNNDDDDDDSVYYEEETVPFLLYNSELHAASAATTYEELLSPSLPLTSVANNMIMTTTTSTYIDSRKDPITNFADTNIDKQQQQQQLLGQQETQQHSKPSSAEYASSTTVVVAAPKTTASSRNDGVKYNYEVKRKDNNKQEGLDTVVSYSGSAAVENNNNTDKVEQVGGSTAAGTSSTAVHNAATHTAVTIKEAYQHAVEAQQLFVRLGATYIDHSSDNNNSNTFNSTTTATTTASVAIPFLLSSADSNMHDSTTRSRNMPSLTMNARKFKELMSRAVHRHYALIPPQNIDTVATNLTENKTTIDADWREDEEREQLMMKLDNGTVSALIKILARNKIHIDFADIALIYQQLVINSS